MTWNNIKDKLPSENTSVLVIDEENNIWIMQYKSSHGWSCPQEGWSMNVTHWMELPLPKKETEMKTREKLLAVQRSPELKKAMSMLICAFKDCDLKSYIRYTYSDENDNKFELTFMPINISEKSNEENNTATK